MEGMDMNWCLCCDSYYNTTDTEGYCSNECFLKVNGDRSSFPSPSSPQPIPINSSSRHPRHPRASTSSFRSESFSELDLSSSSRISPTYPYASSSLRSAAHSLAKASEWAGKGPDGVALWAATVPFGASPGSQPSPAHHRQVSTSSAASAAALSVDACSDSSSITPPSRPRTRASTSSLHTHSTPARCTPSRASKPAPPKVSYVNSLHSQNHSNNPSTECLLGSGESTSAVTPPTPTFHSKSMQTITPHTSLPSLTARSSASASLTSIATPGSLQHASSSRPSSRPVTPPESVHEYDGDCVMEPQEMMIEVEEPSTHVVSNTVRSRKGATLLSNLATQLKSWASSNATANHPPYSTLHQIPRRSVVPPMTSLSAASATAKTRGGSSARSKTVTPPPVPLAHQVHRQDRLRPQQQRSQATIRVQEPVSFLHDDELAFSIDGKGQEVAGHGVVRMGRGLVSSRKVCGTTAGEVRDKQRERAEKERGRKIERVRS